MSPDLNDLPPPSSSGSARNSGTLLYKTKLQIAENVIVEQSEFEDKLRRAREALGALPDVGSRKSTAWQRHQVSLKHSPPTRVRLIFEKPKLYEVLADFL
jgi:hypothetical protein